MANEANGLSVAAIVVALIALVSTIGQSCNSISLQRKASDAASRLWSVLGQNELVYDGDGASFPPLKDRHWVVGSLNGDTAIDALISGSDGSDDESNESVTWLRFLRATQGAHKKMLARLKAGTTSQDERWKAEAQGQENRFLTIPLIKFEEKSWDFMPPDVVKPYARISVSDIAIIARRLGMEWERFEPTDGILRAQGNGYMLTSISVRSVGTMVQISEMIGLGRQGNRMHWVSPIIPDAEAKGEISLIPCAAADKMIFGVLPAMGSDFLDRDFKCSTIGDIKETVKWFTRDTDTVDSIHGNNLTNMGWYPGVSDLLAISAPIMYRPDIGLVGVASPSPLPIFEGVTFHRDGFKEFPHQVRELLRSHPNLDKNSPIFRVRDAESSISAITSEWYDGIDPIDRNYTLLAAVHAAYLQTTSFLSPPNQQGGESSFFRFLVSSHLRYLIQHPMYAYSHTEAQKDAQPRSESGPSPLKYGMKAYFARLPEMLDQMERDINLGGIPGLLVPAARWNRDELMAGWVVLIFRAMLWNRCHYLVQSRTVPVQYCGSQLPVYIG